MLPMIAMYKSKIAFVLIGIGLFADSLISTDAVQTVTLAVAGWTLLEVIKQGKIIAAMQQKVKDLPCYRCREIQGETTTK